MRLAGGLAETVRVAAAQWPRMKTHIAPALRCAIFASAVSLGGTLLAETNTTSTRATSDPTAPMTTERRADMRGGEHLSRADRNFFEKASKSGIKEVAVSESVMNRLGNQQVKQFAQTMVQDHSQANAELMALAQKKGVVLPAKDDLSKLTNKWSTKKDGKDLAEDYMKEMVSDHKDAVDLFEKASKSEDPDIAAFANKTLPKLQAHLQHAKQLERALD